MLNKKILILLFQFMGAKIHSVEAGEAQFEFVCVNSHIFVLRWTSPSVLEFHAQTDVKDVLKGMDANKDKGNNAEVESGLAILDSDVSPDNRMFAVATSTKHLVLFELCSLLRIGGEQSNSISNSNYSCRTTQKTPTSVSKNDNNKNNESPDYCCLAIDQNIEKGQGSYR